MKIKHLTRLVTAVAVAIGFAAGTAVAQDPIRIATEGAYPPFNFTDANGELQGFDVDIANALCKELNRECTIVAQEWDGIIPGLLAKKYDAIVASMSITEERKKKVDFTGKYYSTPNKFTGRKDAGESLSLEDLAGKKIGVARGSIHQCYVEAVYGDSEVVLYANQEEVFADLALGRVDYTVSDAIQSTDNFLSKDEGKDFALIGDDLYDARCHGKGAGIAVRKEDPELREAFDGAIEAIRANGTYQEINAKYFPFDIYGG